MRLHALLAVGIGITGIACSSGSKTSSGTGGEGSGGAPAGGGAGGLSDAGAGDDGLDSGGSASDAGSALYHMGADISWVPHDEHYGATYVDTDGVSKDILVLLKNHGFNSVRLRTFVNPRAADGYDQVDGFADLAHTVSMGQRIKQAGMGFLLALHYSDNWADPGKQCIPVAWQQDTFEQLTQHVHDYTRDVITTLKSVGALPDLVQIGNEITPGLLIHICDPFGIPVSVNPVNGQDTNWANLGTLLKAGIQAVKEVDPSIKIVLHIDKGGDVGASMAWIHSAQAQNVPFDIFADTSYVRWQGQPSSWQNTFAMLATTFPTLSFLIPEYGNEAATLPDTPTTMRIANDIMFNIPNNRGIGAFIYEPEHPAQSGIGIGLFGSIATDAGGIQDSWPIFTALPDAMATYDQMKVAYAGRLSLP
jgi:arabinogalactan endo-1,4-beta-galactosidase